MIEPLFLLVVLVWSIFYSFD